MFELEDHPQEGTLVRFSHGGWASTKGIYANCNFDWAYYLRSLRALVESGEGTPHPDPVR